VQNLRPGAGDKMPGVMCTIDAIGYEAKAHGSSVYFPQDPGAGAEQKEGKFTVALGDAWNKGIGIEMGQAPAKRYNVYLRDLILAGVAKPSFIVSHRLPLAAAPDAYKKFDQRVSGYTKVLLKPQQTAA
jgi:glutathione-independent formaldehyde dehydrogenase